ncbi:probable pectate lyase 8 isoform X3 [Physcomitrium patens]|uniref:probable pectate lyase 8 isoform X3 n=1 Tax=Physcomitrium patens TaxID=3218 RepID=UPI003CCCD388
MINFHQCDQHAAGFQLSCHASRTVRGIFNETSSSNLQDTRSNDFTTQTMTDTLRMKKINHNNSRRMMGECMTGNLIDDCWRCDNQWRQHRQALAKCALGAGSNVVGGANGRIYVVTDDSDADAVNPIPGTLRYGAIQQEPLWITFSQDMSIHLRNELILTSFKTIDGRGFNVHIAGGAGLTLQSISNVIIHGVHIHDTVPTGPATVRSSMTHSGGRGRTDGDAINIYSSHDIWIDHCYFANGADGLVDVTMGSTGVTISNNYFTDHDKVILLGAHPRDMFDMHMRVTVAYNHFGPRLIERLPRFCRIRHGCVHVLNNMYEGWGMYAIGGSEGPTIVSQGNVFTAPNGGNKEVSKRLQDGDDGSLSNWNWQSSGDVFLNGAFFTASGAPLGSQVYSTALNDVTALPATMVATITADAGPLACASEGIC